MSLIATFHTSSKTLLRQNVLIFVGAAIAMFVIVKFIKKQPSYLVAAFWAIGTAFGGCLYYSVRFALKAPELIQVSNDRIVIVWRRSRRPPTILSWSSITSATMKTKDGGNLRLNANGVEIVVWDDGFTDDDWDSLWVLVRTYVEDSQIDLKLL